MANPRKFSEKIALQKQKQAEGTAEFEKIMKEVSVATAKLDDSHHNQRLVEIGTSPTGSSLQSHRESRGRNVGVGPMRRPSDRKVDRSPYSSGSVAYLSPPNDSYWRRASSDSAIHQSLIQTSEKHHGSHSPLSMSPTAHRRSPHVNINTDHRHSLSNSINRNSSDVNIRQGSPACATRLPCINTYPSAHDNSLSNSMGNNTGSLPDLTSVHFSSPLNTPLEKEHEHSSSPFSSSPLNTSPTTLSPTSIPNRHHYSPTTSPSESNTYSPTHFSNVRQRYLDVPGAYSNIQLLNNKEGSDQYRPSHIGQTSHLSFTNLPSLIHVQQVGSVKNANISNCNAIHGSHGHLSSIGITAAGNLTEYRNPQNRPSPGSSPGLMPSVPVSDSNPSAPCSPVPPNVNNNSSHTYDKLQNQGNDGYSLHPSFQNHFEQFSLVDNTPSEYIPTLPTAQNNYSTLQFDESTYAQLGSLPNTCNSQNQPSSSDTYNVLDNTRSKNDDVTNLRRNMSTLKNESQQEALVLQHHSNYQSPNTPTSIPEIVFSDFSSGNQDFSKEIFGSLDLELGPMDVAGLQMLSDPNSTMIADPTIEDSFRRDLN